MFSLPVNSFFLCIVKQKLLILGIFSSLIVVFLVVRFYLIETQLFDEHISWNFNDRVIKESLLLWPICIVVSIVQHIIKLPWNTTRVRMTTIKYRSMVIDFSVMLFIFRHVTTNLVMYHVEIWRRQAIWRTII